MSYAQGLQTSIRQDEGGLLSKGTFSCTMACIIIYRVMQTYLHAQYFGTARTSIFNHALRAFIYEILIGVIRVMNVYAVSIVNKQKR